MIIVFTKYENLIFVTLRKIFRYKLMEMRR